MFVIVSQCNISKFHKYKIFTYSFLMNGYSSTLHFDFVTMLPHKMLNIIKYQIILKPSLNHHQHPLTCYSVLRQETSHPTKISFPPTLIFHGWVICIIVIFAIEILNQRNCRAKIWKCMSQESRWDLYNCQRNSIFCVLWIQLKAEIWKNIHK